MKKIFILLASVLLPLSVSAQSIVGSWRAVNTDRGAYVESALCTITFNEDGTFVRDYGQVLPDSTFHSLYSEGGNWKLILGGKKVMMKVKPSTVKADTGEGAAGGIGKLVETFRKVDALTTITAQAIVLLTDDELVLREVLQDEDGDSYTMETTYMRQ